MKSKVEAATEWMENLANDNSHGYAWGGWGPQDYDCSHAVITAWEQAGVPVKTRGATYTGNMKPVFLNCGFKDVTPSIDFVSGSGLKRGDVILNYAEHVVMYVGPGKIVHARSSEGNTIPGDQSGNEIRIQPYFVYSKGWDCVLRYPVESVNYDDDTGDAEPANPVSPKTGLLVDGECGPDTWKALAARMPVVREGSMSGIVMAMQLELNLLGANLKVDGDCGPLTASAIKKFQEGKL